VVEAIGWEVRHTLETIKKMICKIAMLEMYVHKLCGLAGIQPIVLSAHLNDRKLEV
jgi:hypothetical protein